MRVSLRTFATAFAVGVFSFSAGESARALELDWSGQFRAENHWISNYTLDSGNLTRDVTRSNAGGYYIPGGGSNKANFQTLFMRVKPKVVVNDNIYIKSEWWLGDPIYGFFGSGSPYPADQRQFYSNQSRGSVITAQRFWVELLSDVGTVQIGRAPLHWGLGLVWNSGDGLFDRYQSTGDVIRLVSKFGAFSFVPSIIKYSMGNNVGGACTYTGGAIPCTVVQGGGGLSDYSLMFKYENPDDDFEGGLNFIKRIAGAAQDTNSGYFGVGSTAGTTAPVAGSNFNTWDLYGKKKFGKLSVAGEAPITTGNVGGIDYKSFALALESNYKFNDSWDVGIRAGHSPGQPNITGASTDRLRAFYFNPNYKLGLIMFNYQFANFAGPNTLNNSGADASKLASPFDNPIVNANYLTLNAGYQAGPKWKFRTHWIFAKANETAQPNQAFFNTWRRKYFNNNTGRSQESSLGWEMDYGTTFQWDEAFQFHFDFGVYFPGSYYKFANVAGQENPTATVFASTFRVGVVF